MFFRHSRDPQWATGLFITAPGSRTTQALIIFHELPADGTGKAPSVV
jgi:hypothetical protein